MKMPRKRRTISVASTETKETPPKQSQQQPQDEIDDNPLACIDYACDAISSVVDSLFGNEEEKQTPVQAPVKKPIIVATDASDKKLSQKEEKTVEEKANKKAASASEEGMEQPLATIEEPSGASEGDKKTPRTKQQQKSAKKQSSKKRMKAVFGKFFKKGNKKKSSVVPDNTSSNRASSPKLTTVEQNVAVDMRKKAGSRPESTKEVEIDLDHAFTSEQAVQTESNEHVQRKAENAFNKESAPQQQTTEAIQPKALNTPTPEPNKIVEETPVASKQVPKKVSFGEVIEKDAPPSPTTVSSDAFFGLIDTMIGANRVPPQVHEESLSADRIVPLPDSDSDSDEEHDDSEVESLLDETSNQGTFDVVKDMNEVMSELNDMWQESDQDLVKVISNHISFDEDDDDEPFESDHALAHYEQIVEAEQKLSSFQPQPQIIAAV